MGRKALDLTGKRFYKLTVICKDDSMYDGKHVFWKCICDCGNEIIVRKDSLISGHSKSCSCYLQERYKDGHLKTHGMKNTRLYAIWLGMKQRCYNKNASKYKNYGGRGVTVCDEWVNDFENFYLWSINNGYEKRLTIDRISVNGNYCPENCRWATFEIQNYNKRTTLKVNVNGIDKTLKELEDEYKIPLSILRKRYYKYKNGTYSFEDLVSKEKKSKCITLEQP